MDKPRHARAFVTGASGFIGSNLVDRLLAAGFSVVGYDNFTTGRRQFIAEALRHPEFRLVEADVLDAAALAADVKDGAELEAAHQAGKLFAVIWTTTPWTLPANLGITLNETFDYVALKVGENFYVVAARLADAVEKECGLTVEKRIALSREGLKAFVDRRLPTFVGA